MIGPPAKATCGTTNIPKVPTKEPRLADNHSKERVQAEAAFAKMQAPPRGRAFDQPELSAADQNTARLKAARLERDAAKAEAKKR